MTPRLPALRALLALAAIALPPRAALANEVHTGSAHVAGIVVHDAVHPSHVLLPAIPAEKLEKKSE